ncbi:hypothetical protein LGL55_02740 [Clostridium tagluense]|uniref:hypothetical protein n=1 Tax=Clostridium tagluense TaxID=360422 RepID=UPI001CF3AF6C|nr:hypothetical protein [Clostridium tagluense]MCB2310036.1 hypothetical protein [Clostridium tagluense]MCB2314434.1 hypothetical protein [Clostridium tagluense]MCB2319280.1 hypothetical protein [Clostridium tagluense]MCB2324630.1 hypothetical protein [Clostridium tagluense]MCB2329481.1 hypothetical protein [Clostridium tagluense]
MKELTQQLAQFKQVTIELIRALQQDEIYKLDDLLDSRQIVIENMEKIQYTTEEFTDTCNELNILKVQQELLELMQAKKENTKDELNKIQITKNVNNNYNKSFYANSSMFNKQI